MPRNPVGVTQFMGDMEEIEVIDDPDGRLFISSTGILALPHRRS
jgi:hypothetical protein